MSDASGVEGDALIDERQLLVVLQKIYSVLNFTSNSVGDLLLTDYAYLLTISEYEGGISHKRLERDFVFRKNTSAVVSALEDRELIERIRDKHDRRAYASLITAKGRARIELLDEALAISLIETSGRLTEETFNRLVEKLGAVSLPEEGRKVETLLPASALVALCNYHDAAMRVGGAIGLTTASAAILVMLELSDGPLSTEAIAHKASFPVSSAMLLLEVLSDREWITRDEYADLYELHETGNLKVERFVKRFESLTRGIILRNDDDDADGAQNAEGLQEYAIYLFGGEESGHNPTRELFADANLPAPAPVTNRVAALSSLLAMLARLFSYPTREQALEQTSADLIEYVNDLLAAAGFDTQLPGDVCARCESWAAQPEDARATGIRAEFTRLFYTMPRVVNLNGSDWVHANPTDFSVAHGERAAVGLEYRKLGLQSRAGVSEPFDSLVSELDMLSYVTELEARALDEGDAGSASEWERIRDDFVEHHFRELAQGVARSIVGESDSPFMALCATLLDLVLLRL